MTSKLRQKAASSDLRTDLNAQRVNPVELEMMNGRKKTKKRKTLIFDFLLP